MIMSEETSHRSTSHDASFSMSQRAIELATESLTITKMHLQDCTDRNKKLDDYLTEQRRLDEERENRRRDALDRMKDDLAEKVDDMAKSFRSILYKIVGSAIGVLVLILGYYLMRYGVTGETGGVIH